MSTTQITVKGLEIQVAGKQKLIADGVNSIQLQVNETIKVIKSLSNTKGAFKDIIVVKEGEI